MHGRINRHDVMARQAERVRAVTTITRVARRRMAARAPARRMERESVLAERSQTCSDNRMIANGLLLTLAEAASAAPVNAAPASFWRVMAGVVFIIGWLAACAVWAVMSLMGGLMANDAGRMPAERHAALLRKLMAGEALTAMAGVAGGCAIFSSDHRTLLLWMAGGGLVVGICVQIWAMTRFFSAKP